MKTSQLKYTSIQGWETIQQSNIEESAQLIIIFGSTQLVKSNEGIKELKEIYKNALIVGGSSSGEIAATNVLDDTLVATAVYFEKSTIKFCCEPITDVQESELVGEKVVKDLLANDLVHILVISEGLFINGSNLVEGLRKFLPSNVSVTSGLAGDGANFNETFIYNDGVAKNKMVSAIGFYGKNLKVGYGSLGGWDSFGIERLVTKSENNVLFELDGGPALQIYKSFLGEHAANLPASGLLFPLNLRIDNDSTPVVRTILAVDEEKQSLTFAGNIPEGGYVRLMKANFDRLIEGATNAAKITSDKSNLHAPDLAILISCVGRKLVLKQLIEEEVEGVRSILGDDATLCGFYSYGEISPFSANAKCELHNQTMTITTFKEI